MELQSQRQRQNAWTNKHQVARLAHWIVSAQILIHRETINVKHPQLATPRIDILAQAVHLGSQRDLRVFTPAVLTVQFFKNNSQ